MYTPCRVVAFLVDTSTCMRDSTNGQGRCCVGHYDMNVLALLEGRLHGNTFIVTNLLLADKTSVCFTQAYCVHSSAPSVVEISDRGMAR